MTNFTSCVPTCDALRYGTPRFSCVSYPFTILFAMQALLGDLPALQYSDPLTDPLGGANIAITDTSAGVAEVQKVVISSDAGFVREVQSLALSDATGGTFDVTLSGASDSVEVAFDASAADLKVSLLSSSLGARNNKRIMCLVG